MTLSSRHRIRNSSPGGLRPSTLPLGHGGSPQYWLSHVDRVPFKPPRPGTEPRTLAWKAAVLTTTLVPPPTRRACKLANTTRVVLMLIDCLRCWYTIDTTLVQRLVFAGWGYKQTTPVTESCGIMDIMITCRMMQCSTMRQHTDLPLSQFYINCE